MKIRFLIIGIVLCSSVVSYSCTESEDNPQPEQNTPTDNQPEQEDTESTYELVWADEFEAATIDTTKWSFMIGDGTEYGIEGWGNNELQYYTSREENVFIEEGNLVIEAKEEKYEGHNFTSTRLRTKDKGDWKYGKIEVRARLPKGQGIWPAIWMLPTDEVFGTWPKSGEIDIMELVGHEPDIVHGTVHYGPDWPQNQYQGNPYELEEGDFSDDFHVFSIEWEQDKLDFFVDGNKFFVVSPSQLQPHNYPFNARFHLLLNVAVGGNWPGNPNGTTVFPQRMEVDYVRVYQKS